MYRTDAVPITTPLDAFTRSVEAQLQTRRLPFDLRALREYLAGMWPLVIENDSPEWWADTFLEATAAETCQASS